MILQPKLPGICINIGETFKKNDTLEKYESPNATFRCPKVIRSYGYIII